MIEAIWDSMLNATDKTVIEKGGYGKRRGFGARPLLLIHDLQPYFVGENIPLAQQIDRYPMGGGQKAWAVVERILALRDAAREAGIPIFYTRTVTDQRNELGRLIPGIEAEPRLFSSHPDAQLLPCIKPLPGELVIDKSKESTFYGTPLESYLVKLQIDTLLIAGISTSGSCRATGVDAITRTYALAMVEDCLSERVSASHKTALLDVWMKFGDVVSSAETQEYLRGLR